MRSIFPLLILCLGLTACNLLVFSPQQAFEQLAEAQTPEDEAAAFSHIWNGATDLGFSVYDADGRPLPVSDIDFLARLHAIKLRVNGKTYEHIVIEAENIYILMRE